MVRKEVAKECWYAGGLQFDCVGCGNCCAGPEEGYIWINKVEIERLAKSMGLTAEQTHAKFLVHFGLRHSIKEDPKTKDCVFLTPKREGCRGCAIYSVRPNQCRTWPFWASNLSDLTAWKIAALRCPGINNGRYYTYEEIQAIKNQKEW